MSNSIIDNPLGSLQFSKLYNPYEHFFHNDAMDIFNGEVPNRTPFINILDEDENYRIEMAAPGLKKENFKINVEGSLIIISYNNDNASKEFNIGKVYTRNEFNYCGFSRSFTIPDDANTDHINVKYKDGIFGIIVYKKLGSQQGDLKGDTYYFMTI